MKKKERSCCTLCGDHDDVQRVKSTGPLNVQSLGKPIIITTLMDLCQRCRAKYKKES